MHLQGFQASHCCSSLASDIKRHMCDCISLQLLPCMNSVQIKPWLYYYEKSPGSMRNGLAASCSYCGNSEPLPRSNNHCCCTYSVQLPHREHTVLCRISKTCSNCPYLLYLATPVRSMEQTLVNSSKDFEKEKPPSNKQMQQSSCTLQHRHFPMGGRHVC